MSNSFNLKEKVIRYRQKKVRRKLNFNVTKHLEEEFKCAQLNYFKNKREQKGISHFQEVDMRYDRLRNFIGDDNESKRSTVYWNNIIYERSSSSESEYKKQKYAQLRNDYRLPFAVTLLPTLNLPGSLLRKSKKKKEQKKE